MSKTTDNNEINDNKTKISVGLGDNDVSGTLIVILICALFVLFFNFQDNKYDLYSAIMYNLGGDEFLSKVESNE